VDAAWPRLYADDEQGVAVDTLAAGRRSFTQYAWTDCYVALSAADREFPLEPEDLQRLATAAHLTGRETESVDAWTRAYRRLVATGDAAGAAGCAFWLAFQLFSSREPARGGGWLARAQRLLEAHDRDCVQQGYVLAATAHQLMGGGDPAAAYESLSRALEISERFHDPTLGALARVGLGQVAGALGETRRAIGLLDEAMVAVTAGEVEPVIAGVAYCAVILVCQQTFDLRRAGEWTTALSNWCEAQPDLVPYRGLCLVHRAELMQLRGAWTEAMDEALRAQRHLAKPPEHPAVGMALYLLGELHRLRGDSASAEDLYREANKRGRQPQPGLALLRLDQGRLEAAQIGIMRAVDEAQGRLVRARLLPAYVEIMLAGADLATARTAMEELAGIAAELDSPYLLTISAQCAGAVLLAEGNSRAAMEELRRAWTGWQQLQAPYEAGRVRVLIASACRALGDAEGCEMELDAARSVFQQLGAGPDLTRLAAPVAAGNACGLTVREVEILALVATGASNRAIATDLVISEKTVARHVSNILTKLNLPSRAAATAFAYEHHLA
jgi:DNA-binding CsgD family transcriptional regulator/tetratricopeptide (TPR) repeat protein